jgi:hypothetical protein
MRSFIWALGAFVVLNYLIWSSFTERLLSDRYGIGGDLARLAYIIDSKQVRWQSTDLPLKHILFKDYQGQQIDVVTIGDSFSAGRGEGRNRYYQDYIASLNNLSVLNLEGLDRDRGPFETAIVMLNSGFLDIIRPKFLIIESVERASIERFSKEIDFTETNSIDTIRAFYSKPLNKSSFLDKDFFINNANFKYLYYKIAYLFSDTPTEEVIRKKLSKNMFSVKNSSTLLFINGDIKGIRKATSESVTKLNDRINRFSEMLQARGIKLYFMPAVDKYNLYSEYIVNNPYPKSIFFEELRKLPKQYEFIDTKKILHDAVMRGEKDIYYADDTHWSWRASELIFTQVRFKR